MKNLINKLQKQINGLSKLTMLNGEVYLTVEIKCNTGLELMRKSDEILNSIEGPEGFTLDDNLLSRKDLKVYIGFNKI